VDPQDQADIPVPAARLPVREPLWQELLMSDHQSWAALGAPVTATALPVAVTTCARTQTCSPFGCRLGSRQSNLKSMSIDLYCRRCKTFTGHSQRHAQHFIPERTISLSSLTFISSRLISNGRRPRRCFGIFSGMEASILGACHLQRWLKWRSSSAGRVWHICGERALE
jgi:hypothetical protein